MLAHSHVDESLHTHIHMKSVDFSGAKFKQGAKESLRIVIIVKSVDRILFFYDPPPKRLLENIYFGLLRIKIAMHQCNFKMHTSVLDTNTHTYTRTHTHTHTHTHFPVYAVNARQNDYRSGRLPTHTFSAKLNRIFYSDKASRRPHFSGRRISMNRP